MQAKLDMPFVLLIFLFFSIPTFAQQDLIHASHIQDVFVAEKDSPLAKLTSGLQQLHRTLSQTGNRQHNMLSRSHLFSNMLIEEEHVLVELIAKGQDKALVEELKNLRFEFVNSFGNIICGRLHINDLQALTNLDYLKYARPVYKPITNIGNVDSQGDTALYSQQARANYNVDGSGIKIGALSNSYNTLGGAAAGVASGDLPGVGNPNGYTTPVTVLKEYSGTASDETRAMLEHIHDIAPGAQLYARTAFDGIADFAQGILDLAAAGCDVIVDDVTYFAEPFFQDGLIAQAVDSVVRAGKVYFTAAGNSGRKSYESAGFTDSGFTLGGNPIHDFDTGAGVDYGQQLTIPAGLTIYIGFQWDDPYGSLPNSVAGADTDMDIYLYNASFSSALASSTTSNIVTGDPYEVMGYTNGTGGSQTVNVVIVHKAGPAPGFMKYVCWSNSVTIDEYDTQSATLIGHANATHAISTGAAAYFNTPAYGASPAGINSFSSAGGTPVFFDSVGNTITTAYREKPVLVGPDGGNTTFFGSDIPQDADTYPNFFGTSASAPHLAAGASLLLEKGATNQAQIIDAFINTASDMDDPATAGSDTGFDYGTGYGFANVNSALAYFVALPVELLSFTVQPLGTDGGRLRWQTVSEHNNSHFVLQHSENKGRFKEIAYVQGKGISQLESEYLHDVHHLSAGDHYFRLIQVDWDHNKTEHGIVHLNIRPDQNEIWTYMDDATQMVAVQPAADAKLDIEIYNISGQLLHSASHQLSQGERFVTEISQTYWPKGNYFYHILITGNSHSDRHSGKFVK